MASPAYRTSVGTIGTNPSVNVAVTGDYAIVAAITPSGTPTMGNANYTLVGSQVETTGTSTLWVWVNALVASDFDAVSLTAVANTELVMLCYTGAASDAPAAAFQNAANQFPSVTVPAADATLVGIGRWRYSTSASRDIAPPAGMTERYDTAGSQTFNCEIADEAIASPGATGTRAVTVSGEVAVASASLAIPSLIGFPVGAVPI